MRKSHFLTTAALALLAVACDEYHSAPPKVYRLHATAKLEIVDDSATPPSFGKKQYRKIMVVPPSGTARGEFEQQLASIEREFIKRGLTVITPAITARVVANEKTEGNLESRGGAGLSDVERALILAKGTNAEAVLQIGAFKWQGGTSPRFFRAPAGSTDLVEVSQEEYNRPGEEAVYKLANDWCQFIGRLIDVESGEVVVSFNLWQGITRHLPYDYDMSFTRTSGYQVKNGQYVIDKFGNYVMGWKNNKIGENWEFDDPDWVNRAKNEIVAVLLSRVSERTAGKYTK